MKLSVIIPVYNVEKYLERCLDSVVNQTYKDLQIIIVNDGSTDNSLKIAQKYANEDLRIVLIDKQNGGQSSSRNAGLNIANGDAIAFLDSDDWLELNAYEMAMKELMDKDADMAWFSMKNVSGESEKLNVDTKEVVIYTQGEIIKKFFGTKKNGPSLSCCNKVIKRNILNEVRFIEGKTCEDIMFNYQVFSKINKIVRFDAELYHYFQRSGSTSFGKIKRYSFDFVEIWDSIILQEDSKLNIKMSQYNKLHNIFTVLLRATTFGVDDSFDDFEKYKKTYLSFFRSRIITLLCSRRIDIKRKFAATLLFFNYDLCGKIARKILNV